MSAVCAACFDDRDLRRYIEEADGEPGCDYCGEEDAPTVDIDDLGVFMRERLELFYSDANEHLTYISREGGYQGTTYDTYDLLFDEVQIDLPRDSNQKLFGALIEAVEPNRTWCEYDPAVLPEGESMLLDWKRFCDIIKYHRRFFFHDLGGGERHWDDAMAAADLLKAICRFIDGSDTIVGYQEGFTLYRARRWQNGMQFTRPEELGPPPRDAALQTNRMNPPGIPMFYGAEDQRTALAEVGGSCSLGRFVTRRDARILDLVNLPDVPGIFSTASRARIIALSFLHDFSRVITLPVDRDNRTILDYIPTQVLTEYLRDYAFARGRVDGIRYWSAAVPRAAPPPDSLFGARTSGVNVLLFASQADIVGGAIEERQHQDSISEPWIALLDVSQIAVNSS